MTWIPDDGWTAPKDRANGGWLGWVKWQVEYRVDMWCDFLVDGTYQWYILDRTEEPETTTMINLPANWEML